MADPRLEIYDIMACNVYWDFRNTGLGQEQHKFLVSFYPTGGVPVPELIESITAYGPNGYEVSFENQLFTGLNRNGHIYDRTTNGHWYMVNLDTGFMPEGEYVIEAKGKDGRVTRKSRYQKSAPGRALVGAYRECQQAMYDAYSPGQGDVLSGPPAVRHDARISWKTLKELTGQDGYYIFRLSEGANQKEFDTQNLFWWDNIFLERMANPTAGLNRSEVRVGNPLEAGKSYVYFTEITDSNAMGETNICIFQPYQSFRA